MAYILLVIFIIVLLTSILMIVQKENSEENPLLDDTISIQDKNTGNEKRFDSKHLFIRLIISIFLPVITFAVFMNLSDNGDREHLVNQAMGAIALVTMGVIIWYIYITVETIWLHFKEKYSKRNANLLIISISALAGVLFCILSITRDVRETFYL